MKKVTGYLLCFLLFLNFTSSRAQVLVFSPHKIMGFQTSVTAGAVVADSVALKDTSASGTFSSPITFHCAIDSGGTSVLVNTNDTATFAAVSITGGHTQTFVLHRTYGTNNTTPSGPYKTGINVIVIWPSCTTNPSAITRGDTLIDTVYIAGSTSGIRQLSVYNLFSMYPNPSNGLVNLDNHLQEGKEVEWVTLWNEAGQVCARFQKQYTLDLSDLPKGLYLAEVVFRDGSVGRRKLVLQ
jgi:hypothetical protein